MTIYIVTMQRDGREGHHYGIGTYTDLAKAYIDGIDHGRFHRAGKYEPFIEECIVDSNHLKEVPLNVAFNFAKMRHPEKFDDRGNLKEEEK